MKKITFILLAFSLSVSVLVAQNKKAPKAEFATLVHDFKKVNESTKIVSTEFKFKNTGDAPLIIQRVQTTCGCTVPEYAQKPILPGMEGVIKISYEAEGRPGIIDKRITVFTNVPDEVYVLSLKGEVIRK